MVIQAHPARTLSFGLSPRIVERSLKLALELTEVWGTAHLPRVSSDHDRRADPPSFCSRSWRVTTRYCGRMAITKGSQQLVAEASARVRGLSVNEAQALLDNETVTFVDLRDPRELEREGMIPGAFHATRGMLEFWVDPDSPYYKPVFGEDRQFVLYCGSGWRSALAAATMLDMGFNHDKVAHLNGGFTAWKQAGAPVGEKPFKAIAPDQPTKA